MTRLLVVPAGLELDRAGQLDEAEPALQFDVFLERLGDGLLLRLVFAEFDGLADQFVVEREICGDGCLPVGMCESLHTIRTTRKHVPRSCDRVPDRPVDCDR